MGNEIFQLSNLCHTGLQVPCYEIKKSDLTLYYNRKKKKRKNIYGKILRQNKRYSPWRPSPNNNLTDIPIV
jgi:hypothetical protein